MGRGRGVCVVWLLLAASDVFAQNTGQRPAGELSLRRRAQWNASLTPADSGGGAIVRRVTAGSTPARAGMQVGDRLIALNGASTLGADDFRAAFRRVRGGDSVSARVVRAPARGGAGDTVSVRFVVDSVAREQIPGTSVAYGAVRSERGHIVRTVTTRPERASAGRLPAVLFIPWLSCDPVEKPEPGNDGFAHMLRDVASGSGMILTRVEKPGVGDSDGPDCRDAGLDDDLAAFRAALRVLRVRPDVDTTKVFLLGGSIGGALAAVLAAESPGTIAGVIAVGGFSRTWYEHMLEIERQRLTLSGRSPAQVNADMRGFVRFYQAYLLDGRTPAEVLATTPELRPLWYDEPAHQYGRPAAYYQAVQRLNVEQAWAALANARTPSLIIWGEYDWIMSRAEAERAAEIVNATAPGRARLVILPKTGHGLMAFETMAASFAGERPRNDGAAGRAVNAWLQNHRVIPSEAPKARR